MKKCKKDVKATGLPVAAGQAVHGAAAPRRCGLGEAAGFTELPKQKNRMRVQAGILAWVAMLVVAGYSCTRIMEAGDTWVALACGRHIVNHGVVTADPFSFNSLFETFFSAFFHKSCCC